MAEDIKIENGDAEAEEKNAETSGSSDQNTETKTSDSSRKPEGSSGSDTETKDKAEGSSSDASADGKKEEAGDGKSSDAKKKPFHRDKKDREIDELARKNADLTDRYKRMMAEYANYQKRTEKEKASMFDLGARSIIEKVLPALDNFERGLSTLTDEQKAEPFAAGMQKVYDSLVKDLKDAGLEVIEAKDKPFDPNFHNAVMHVDDDSVGENTVVEEFQKGYTWKGSVVRHSMVKVAN